MDLEELLRLPPYSLDQKHKLPILWEGLDALASFHRDRCPDYARLLVAVPPNAADLSLLKTATSTDWAPEVLAVGSRAAYLWCANGILESPLAKAVNRALGDRITARNWTTMQKLHSLVNETP